MYVGNDVYKLTKYDKRQITDTTETKFSNIGSDLLEKWNNNCNSKSKYSRDGDIVESTKKFSPTVHAGAPNLPPIGNVFLYIEKSSTNSNSDNIFVSSERTDIFQNTIIFFCFNRYSILTKETKKPISRFRVQLLLEHSTWSTRYNIPKRIDIAIDQLIRH